MLQQASHKSVMHGFGRTGHAESLDELLIFPEKSIQQLL